MLSGPGRESAGERGRGRRAPPSAGRALSAPEVLARGHGRAWAAAPSFPPNSSSAPRQEGVQPGHGSGMQHLLTSASLGGLDAGLAAARQPRGSQPGAYG